MTGPVQTTPLLAYSIKSSGGYTWAFFVPIAPISDIFFVIIKQENQAQPSYFYVWVLTTWEGSINPDDPSRLYSNTYLIPYTCPSKFVAEPFPFKRTWLVDLAISSIDSDFGTPANIFHKPIIKINL